MPAIEDGCELCSHPSLFTADHPGSGKGKIMRWFWVLVVLLSVGGVASGQDSPQPDQLKKMYDGVLGELRQAQDRKNELAAENDKLNAKVADLQKQLDAAKLKIDEANREAAGFAERTFFLRSYYANWQEFIRRYPKLEARWQVFLEGDVASPWPLTDKDWPLGEMQNEENANVQRRTSNVQH